MGELRSQVLPTVKTYIIVEKEELRPLFEAGVNEVLSVLFLLL